MRDTLKYKSLGIVEGFFSKPLPVWSLEERAITLKFVTKYAPNINAYLYCPKDDLFVTKKWDNLYPAEQLKQIGLFIKLCYSKRINYFYGLNPSLDRIGNSKDQARWETKVSRKFTQLQGVGCQNFCLLFDDLPLAYDVTSDKYDDRANNETQKLISLVNNIYAVFNNSTDNLWVCCPDYCFNKKTILTKQLKNLNRRIPVFWTGDDIFSKKISLEDIKRVKKILGKNRQLIFWSNYPVNDCEQNIGVYNLGGFYKIGQKIFDDLGGIFVNPMREPYASLPFFVTFSDYLTAPQNYDRRQSWKNAMEILTNNQKYNRLYQNSLKEYQIITNNFGRLNRIIKSGIGLSPDVFRKLDLFPTNPKVAKYYPEIVNIVLKRLALLSPVKLPGTKLAWFNKKYPARKKIFITRDDEKLILKEIKSLLNFEREQFLQVFNDQKVKTETKLALLKARQKINRFTTDKKCKILRGKFMSANNFIQIGKTVLPEENNVS